MKTTQQITVERLREIVQKIEERDKRGATGTTNIQRLHRGEMPLVLSAIRGWANHLETEWYNSQAKEESLNHGYQPK